MTISPGQKLIFLESNTTGTGRLFIRAARLAGFDAVLLAANPELYPFAKEDSVSVVILNTQDENEVIATCHLINSQGKIAGIISTSDHYLSFAARLANMFDLPGPSAEAITACRSKSLQYRALSNARIPVPATATAETVSDAVAIVARMDMPVVVKPEQGTGSVGVKLCGSVLEAEGHARFLLSQQKNERGILVRPRIVIQEFVEGPEYSVEIIDEKVIGITKKHLGLTPHFVETGHDYPAILSDEMTSAIQIVASTALSKLGMHWGAAHIEVRLASDGPRIIEVNPRLTGGFIPELIRLASGIDIISELISYITGRTPIIRPVISRFAAIRFIIPQSNGTLRIVTGVNEAMEAEGVVDVQIYREIGSNIHLSGDFRDRVGHIIACGDDPNIVTLGIERALSSIKVQVR